MDEKLREAACFGDVEGLVTLLSEGSADVNAQHKLNGWTALHWAAKRNNLACVEALMARGADKMLFTAKGELAAHLTTNKTVLQALGYSGQHTKERQKKTDENTSVCSTPTFVPHYIRHPPLNYKVDLERKSRQGSRERGVVNSLGNSFPQFRILKMRLVGSDDYDTDFIEVDMPLEALTFRGLVHVICEEFSVEPAAIVKIRKLPNTKLRRDAEVQRLTDYQELEIEIV